MPTSNSLSQVDSMMKDVLGEPEGFGLHTWKHLRSTASTALERSPSSRCDLAVARAALHIELGELARADDLIDALFVRWDAEPQIS